MLERLSGNRVSSRGILLAVVAGACVALDAVIALSDPTELTPSVAGPLVFLSLLAIPLSIPRIALPRGHLTLGAIAMNAGALNLSPRFAAVVGLVTALTTTLVHRRVLSVRLLQLATVTAGPVCASVTRVHAEGSTEAWIASALALIVASAAPLVLTGLIGSILSGEVATAVIGRNLNRHWTGAFLYFAAAGVLIGRLLNGSVEGYALSTLVAVLALALSDSVAGREMRLRLLSQLNDAERVVAYSRVVEGTVHNLRNHLAAAAGHLDEVAISSIVPADARHVTVASGAVADAVELLDELQGGTSDRREYRPLDVSSLVRDCCVLLRGRADKKRIALDVRAPRTPVTARTDPLRVKQIVSNLVLNAIDAVGTGGRIDIDIGSSASFVNVSVTDDGPGVPEKFRARLFEPHFTTKPHGNGIGLYVSYQLARDLGGDLRYEGSRTGGVFTLTLPSGV